MKVYHAVALSALAVPIAALAPPVAAQVAPVPAVVALGPVHGTVINPGGPIGPVHGTVINPGAGGRLPGCASHGHHSARSHRVHCG